MLAKNYDEQSIMGWLMSEKLDGIRAIWTGSKLVSRNGNQFFAPKWFTDQLPAGVCLDGELFINRGMFQKTVSIVKKHAPIDSEWSHVRYCVFDAPDIDAPFKSRLAFCKKTVKKSTVAEIVEHHEFRFTSEMEAFYSDVVASGAEGIMLRDPKSKYEHKRSNSLLKYKPFESDEAVMIGAEGGEGKFSGMVGAIVLKWRGVTFKVGSGLTDEIRTSPPKIGAAITFGFCGLTDGGIPRFPTFVSERSYE
jgi:DNA ligase 1